MDAARVWRNPPPFFSDRDGVLTVRTRPKTDFWNNTFYGFLHANGHFLAGNVAGDFTATVEFSADYRDLYDQAGLMLRVDDRTWVKAGVEFTDGATHFSVVVTRDDQSDWSMMPIEGMPAGKGLVTARLTRHGEAIRVQVKQGEDWRLARLAFLPMPEAVEIGPMCCSPVGEGLQVRFTRLEVGAPIPRELHD